ncbi:MAG: HAD-IIA family hydrolase [Jatrophihabitantaceae bacterium]
MTSMTLLGSDTVLAERYDVALLDLDGVVYLGPNAIEGVPQALAQARDRGMRLAFVTNNAARPPAVVATHLTELGIAASSSEVTTSAQAAAHYLAQRFPAGARVLVVGTVGLTEALAERGLVPVERDGDDVVAMVQGYSPDLNWHQLAQGAIAINRGALWVATNLDPTVPSPQGRLPGNGSMVAALQHATGADPISTGKPDPTMHRESVERSGAKRPIVVGDRLDTDIEGANAVGCPSLLVLSGVTTARELLGAAGRMRPSYLADDVSGLLQTHRQPTSVGDRIDCGSWSVQADPSSLTLRCNGDVESDPVQQRRAAELDALRALCVATWRGPAGPRHAGADEQSRRVLSLFGVA